MLVVRVHPELLQSEGLPDELIEETFWEERYRSIVDLENHLHRNGTRIIKFFLSQIILDTLNELGMSYPELDKTRRKELQWIRELLENEVQNAE